ncbi:outer membrane biogenesis lipoprotein LolB [Desulfosalsimonas propionicica]|uniref:Outer membrane biogenesis lipoprotein LolB n=1 Tax=Desulfosalsimonas propionicica TaxID=332175 RepID=A0A7W0HL04_9BACT|nr:hypothetical protein [Desulfosalsimonas propionicica]MBA2881748.1 outer membrane biogenesis lipoprotein LolB [Desulfosalsimonas propionicica]
MKGRLIVLFLILLTAACASVEKPPPSAVSRMDAGKAESLLACIRKANEAMTPYKAIGRIGVDDDSGSWSVRAAWLGAPGGRFRVEAMGLAGQPFGKIICGPELCSFHFPEGGELRRRDTGRRSLGRLAGVDIDVDDLALLLGGGVPIADHDSVAAYRTLCGDPMLVLKKRFSGTVQHIRFSTDPIRVREVEMFTWQGTAYRAEILAVRSADERNMPSELQISDAEGHRLSVSVERCWADAAVPARAFSPELPGNTDTAP